MAAPVTYDIDELKKVVVIDSSEQGDDDGEASQQPGGGEGESMPDVEIVDVAEEKAEGGEGEEGEEKDGEEGEEKEGDGKPGKGKPGKPSKGKPSQGEGEAGAGQAQDVDDVIKKADDLMKEIEDNRTGKHSCGSDKKRKEKQVNTTEDADRRRDKYREAIDRIQEKLDDAAAKGIKSPMGTGKGRGEGKQGAPSEYTPLPMEKPRPAFLDEIMDFAERGYTKDYTKKGTDWLYSEAFDYDIFFKDRPKVAVPGKWMFLMVDCSGSMTGDFSGDGKSLLEHLVAYLPTIAKEFEGEVWWVSDGIITLADGTIGRTDLNQFKYADPYELEALYKNVVESENFGGGTTFAVELQTAVKLRESEGHDAAIILLTDSYIDNVRTKYTWKGEVVVGNLPPNTIIMTDTMGKEYMERNFAEDLESDKKIEVYDITEGGEYTYGRR